MIDERSDLLGFGVRFGDNEGKVIDLNRKACINFSIIFQKIRISK